MLSFRVVATRNHSFQICLFSLEVQDYKKNSLSIGNLKYHRTTVSHDLQGYPKGSGMHMAPNGAKQRWIKLVGVWSWLAEKIGYMSIESTMGNMYQKYEHNMISSTLMITRTNKNVKPRHRTCDKLIYFLVHLDWCAMCGAPGGLRVNEESSETTCKAWFLRQREKNGY